MSNPIFPPLLPDGRSPDPSTEFKTHLAAGELSRAADIMQEAARDFMNAATTLKESCDVLGKLTEKLEEQLRELNRHFACNPSQRRRELHEEGDFQPLQGSLILQHVNSKEPRRHPDTYQEAVVRNQSRDDDPIHTD